VDLVLDEPGRQALPLAGGAAVDGQPGLGVLVLALLQVFGHFLKPDATNHRTSAMFTVEEAEAICSLIVFATDGEIVL